MPGVIDYFLKEFGQNGGQKVEVITAKPFVNVAYPPILEKKMEEINPTYAIALGEALRKFE
jgi:hypothetical protein